MQSLQICGRPETREFLDSGFSHMISIGDEDDVFEGLRLPGIQRENHLCLRFSDTEDSARSDAPTAAVIAPLFDWLSASRVDRLLIHCTAGIGRSPAVALLSLSALDSGTSPSSHMDYVAESARCDYIWPNRLVVEVGDSILGREGEIVGALEQWRTAQNIRKSKKV